MWNGAEAEHVANAKAASHRRDNNIDPFTEDQLRETAEMFDKLYHTKSNPAQFRGDRAGRAPPIVVDGDPCDSTDVDRRTDEEYRVLMEAARPRMQHIPSVTRADFERCATDPMALLCVTMLSESVRTTLGTINSRLRALMLSETPHDSLEDFQESCNAPEPAIQCGEFQLFVIYADYGVLCDFGADWVLRGYAFTCPRACVRS